MAPSGDVNSTRCGGCCRGGDVGTGKKNSYITFSIVSTNNTQVVKWFQY